MQINDAEGLAGVGALVTGASRGIGRACAIELAAAGVQLLLAARGAATLEVAEEIRAQGGRAEAILADVSSDADLDRVFARADEVLPHLGIAVLAAGTLAKASILEMPDQDWDRVMGVNLVGAIGCSRRAFTRMARSGGGVIVNFSSLSGVPNASKFPGLAAYNISKYGVAGLAEALAVEGRELGIRSVCISPGAVDTQMLREAAPDLVPRLTPEDVAHLVRFACSGAGASLDGANLVLPSNG